MAFGLTFKNKLGEFFSIDTDKYRVSYQNPFTVIPVLMLKRYVKMFRLSTVQVSKGVKTWETMQLQF